MTTINKLNTSVMTLALVLGVTTSQLCVACGGFFCDVVPIDQAGEQIVFRQEGNKTTAMIKIDYVGTAKDFGWVLPVPQTPELSLGNDRTFTELERVTRPQFLLRREGQGCFVPSPTFSSSSSGSSSASSSSGGSTSVVVEQVVSVGPFDAQIVSSDDPKALATWLADNNLDLTAQGSDLLEPYINEGSKFVVLKLKNNAVTGSIQPIILEYESSTPVIPMTLTAVAAQNNMGVLVWLLGDGRGVPKNFKHVTPNYSRLNWFRGTRTAYSSYQTLITQAMDEAGGQGFATDFAGHFPNLIEQLSTAEPWEQLMSGIANTSDATFIATLWTNRPSPAVQNAIRATLPTSDGQVYSSAIDMDKLFTVEELATTRTAVEKIMAEQVIDPINNALDIFDDNLYLTRLYTTLSADEMTQNPAFTFNPQMDGQQLTRNATLTQECVDGRNNWTLKLGEGTGREDETIVQAWGTFVPFSAPAVSSSEQLAVWRVEKTSATNDPVLLAANTFDTSVRGQSSSSSSSASSTGSVSSSSSSSSGMANNTSSGATDNDSKSGGSTNGWLILAISLLAGLTRLCTKSKHASTRRMA